MRTTPHPLENLKLLNLHGKFTIEFLDPPPPPPPLGVIFRFAQEVTRIIDFANFDTVSSIL